MSKTEYQFSLPATKLELCQLLGQKIMSQKHSNHGLVVMEVKNSWQWTYVHEIARVVGGTQHNSDLLFLICNKTVVIKIVLHRLGSYQNCPPHDQLLDHHVWVSMKKKTFDNQIAFWWPAFEWLPLNRLLNSWNSWNCNNYQRHTAPWCHLKRK